MRLEFGVDDEDEFHHAKDRLLDELTEALGPAADLEVVGDAGLLLDWRWGYSTGELDRFDRSDLAEFLLQWCPRKVSTGPEGYRPIVEGARTWIRFLVDTGRWRGGPTETLLSFLDEVEPDFFAAMSDPSNFGMAKGMFMGPALAGADLDLDDPASVQAAIDRFNALPLEERRAQTDPFMGGPGATGGRGSDPIAAAAALVESIRANAVDLPRTPPPDSDAAARVAAAAPLIVQIDALAEALPDGIALTAKGNPKLAPARTLAEGLGTDDLLDRSTRVRTRSFRSADELPHLLFLLDVMYQAGALEGSRTRLRLDPDWLSLDPRNRCADLLDAVLALGPITHRAPTEFLAELDSLLDAGILHWLTPAFILGERPFDDIVEECLAVVTDEYVPRAYARPEARREVVCDRVAWALDALERCGVIEWRDSTLSTSWMGTTDRVDGTVVVTELGRLLLPDHLLDIGMRVRTRTELREATATEVVDELDDTVDLAPEQAWAQWWPDADPADKVDAVIDVLAGADAAVRRLGAVALLTAAPFPARRRVESLLDGPLAGYASMALRTDDEPAGTPPMLADVDVHLDAERTLDADLPLDAEPHVVLAPVVDLLWLQLDGDPDDLVAQFEQLADDGAVDAVLDSMWRVPTAEALEVLEFLGREHPDKAVAKAARTAAFKYRSRRTG